MVQKYLYFSLGPVQGFVAQARKTRDFWAGSFILSYLSGRAMLAIRDNGGDLIIPKVTSNGEIEDPFLKVIKGMGSSSEISESALISTVPNRFTASVPDDFDPQICVEAVKSSWKKIADAVWKAYVEPVERFGRGTREIWDRQVDGFWEVTWAVEEKAEDGKKGLSPLLDCRKNWRSWVLSAEPGDKCTLMGGLQEISGWIRSKEKSRQEKFWKSLREKVGRGEIDEKERLSAVALIKRLFPLVSYEAVGIKNIPQRYPSTPYIAAVPWIAKAVNKLSEDVRKYAASASRLPGVKYRREDPERFDVIKKVLDQHPWAREFAILDGNCYFEASLSNPNLWKENETGEDFKELRSELKDKLKDLMVKVGEAPSPFFALLLMDGDRMGRLISQNDANEVSGALGRFSSKVPEMVRRYNGILVYAGGDDVMAMLPMDGVLKLAQQLRDAYIESFSGTNIPKKETTLSGAVVFAHYTTPLTAVIKEAHRLLDDIAKDKIGRDSLAVSVWKGSGRVLTWSTPWEAIKKESGSIIDEFVQSFSSKDSKEKVYNSTFFYNLRQRLSVLLDITTENKDDEVFHKILLGTDELIDFMAAEYRRNREREVSWEEAQQRMARLLKICRRRWRDEKYEQQVDENSFGFDGLMLIKFLAQKGVESR